MKSIFTSLFAFDLLIHITFLFTILFLFFILVGFQKERHSLVSNLKHKSRDILDNNTQFKNIKKEYQQLPVREQGIYLNLLLEQIESSTKFQKTHNSLLKGFGYFLIAFLVGVSIYYSYHLMQKGKMWHNNYLINSLYNIKYIIQDIFSNLISPML